MAEVKFGNNKTEISISDAVVRYAERHCPCKFSIKFVPCGCKT